MRRSVPPPPSTPPAGTTAVPQGEMPLAFVLCCGFHHTKGNRIEFCVPSLNETYPSHWDALPFVALPDGSHKSSEDYVFFTTYSPTDEPLYGVSCYRQVAANDKLRANDATVTRSSVQKSIVALVRLPLFGVVRSILSAATHAYFNQENFQETEILSGIFRSINVSLARADVVNEFHSYVYMGIDARQLLLKYGRNALVLFKLLLAGKKMILYTSCGIEKVCNEVLALCSLVPGGLTHLSLPMLEAAKLHVPLPDHHELPGLAEQQRSGEEQEWLKLGFPLLPFSNSDLVQSKWSGVSGKRAHKKMILYPFASLHALDEMKAADGFLAATSNQLFLSLPAEQAHVVVREDSTLDVRPGHEKTAQLTAPDRRFVDAVLDTVRKAEDGQFLGSDGWVREQFREYLAGLLSGCGHVANVFDANPSVKLIPEVLDYGGPFVMDFMQTGCFARWMHACERNYCMIGDLLLHPSGPPTDAMDALADQAAEISENFAELKERARQKWGSFFSGGEKVEHSISSPIMDAPIAASDASPSSPPHHPSEETKSTSPDVVSKFKSWWNQPK